MRRRSVVRAQVNKCISDADDAAEATDIDSDAKSSRFPRICSGRRILENCPKHHTTISDDFFNPEACEGRISSSIFFAIWFVNLKRIAGFRQQIDDPGIESSRAAKTTERLCEAAGRAVVAVIIRTGVLDVLYGFDYVAQAVIEGRGIKIFLSATAHF
jgi:hypothetical protein